MAGEIQPTAPQPITSVGNIISNVTDKFRRTEESATAASEIVQKAGVEEVAAQQQFINTFELIRKSQERVFDSAQAPLGKLETISKLPTNVSKIMGFFNPDFNAATQNANLQRSQFELNKLTHQADSASRLRDARVQGAEAIKTAAKDFYTINRQGFLDTVDLARFGFQVSQNTRREQVQAVQDLTQEQLTASLTDATKIPRILRGAEGLLETEQFRRRAEQLTLEGAEGDITATSIANRINSKKIAALEREDFFDQQPSMDSLLTLFYNPDRLPEGIFSQDVNQEMERRTSITQALRTAELAIGAREVDLFQSAKATALAGMSRRDITQRIQQANTAGKASITTTGGVEFTVAEMRTALAAKTKSEADEDAILMRAAVVGAGIEGKAGEFDNTANMLAKLLNPGVANVTIEGLPQNLRNQVLTVEGQLGVLSQFSDSPAAVEEMVRTLDGGTAQLNEFLNDVLDNQFTKKSQPAVREFVSKSGRMDNVENVANYLIGSGANQFALDYDPVLSSPWTAFSATLNELTGQQLQTFELKKGAGGETTIATSKDELGAAEQINAVVKQSKVRNVFTSVGFQELAKTATLNAIAQGPGTPKSTVLSKVINPISGNLTTAFRIARPDGGQIFDVAAFLNETAKITVAARKANALGPDEDIASIMLNEMRANIARVNDWFLNDPNAAALHAAAFNNNAAQLVLDEMAAIMPQVQTSINNAQETANALENVIRTETFMQVDPGAAP